MKKRVRSRLLEQQPTGLARLDSKRLAIVQAAIRSIAREGIHETSLFSIAKDLKVRRSLVTHYFKNIYDLIQATIGYALQVGQEITVSRLLTAVGTEETLVAIVEATFHWMEREPEQLAVAQLGLYYATYDSAFSIRSVTNREFAEGRIAAVLATDPKWLRAGKGKIAERARMIRTYHLGSVIAFGSTGLPISLDEFREEVIRNTLRLAKYP